MLTEAQALALAARIREVLPDWRVQVKHTSEEDLLLLWEHVPEIHARPLEDLLTEFVGWFVSASQGDPLQSGVTVWRELPPELETVNEE